TTRCRSSDLIASGQWLAREKVVAVPAGAVSGQSASGNGHGLSADPTTELLRLAASAERGSEHPLGEAIVRAAQEQNLVLSEPESFEGIASHGIRATVDGYEILLGNLRLMEREGVSLNDLEPQAAALQRQAKTTMWMAVDGVAAAVIGVADVIKEGSQEAIAQLHELGLLVVMMTGDNEATAQAIAAEAGIDRVF